MRNSIQRLSSLQPSGFTSTEYASLTTEVLASTSELIANRAFPDASTLDVLLQEQVTHESEFAKEEEAHRTTPAKIVEEEGELSLKYSAPASPQLAAMLYGHNATPWMVRSRTSNGYLPR